jgi:hypothetical protein
MKDSLKLLLKFKKEIGIYLLTRIALIWVLIKYLDSAAFLDDIHFLYFYATHPLCLITGSFIEGAGVGAGAYAPLEPLILAPFTELINGINSIRLATFTFEFITLIMMIIIGNKIIKEDILHKTILIYILIPLSWVENIIWAQDEILSALFILIVLYFKLKNKDDLAALSLGLTCICAKIVPFIVFVPLLLTSRNKKRTFLLVVLPILAFLIPINMRYKLLGIENPFYLQIINGGFYSLTIPYLFKLIFDTQINWGILAFILLSVSFFFYYSYLVYRYWQNNMPDFIDMSIISFLLYFVFFFGGIHPEHYIFILPVILLRLAMLDKINFKEIELLIILSISSITWKISALLDILAKNNIDLKGSVLPIEVLEAHNKWIGNRFFKLEQVILLTITLMLIFRYIIIFIRKLENASIAKPK